MTITYRVYDSYKVRPIVDELNRRGEFEEFPLTIGDRLPYIDFSLIDPDENPYDLTGHEVRFFFMRYGNYYPHNLHPLCVITEAVSGFCHYEWGEEDIATEGIHVGQLEVTKPDGKKLSIPYPLRFKVRAKMQLD